MTIFVILGNKLLANNEIHNILKRRLDKCIENYKEGDKVIVSGGNVCGIQSHNNNGSKSKIKHKICNHSEAFVMRSYLYKNGMIPMSDIILENKSKDTIENIKNVKKILDKLKIRNITLITSNWHLSRVMLICNHYIPYIKICPLISKDNIDLKRFQKEMWHSNRFIKKINC